MSDVFALSAMLDAYSKVMPDNGNPSQKISFGTSGHRGKSLNGSFNEAHILAITQAVCDYRKKEHITGPLYIGKDTHALSSAALETAFAVLVANRVTVITQSGGGPTPTPTISHAILRYNRGKETGLADGIVITPSHNPPEDGGFKYNEFHGGPASAAVTNWIEARANELLAKGNKGVRATTSKKQYAEYKKESDLRDFYISHLHEALNMDAIAESGLCLGADPLGGASLPYWEPIAEKYGLNLTVVNTSLDPLFSFMPPDHDGKTRMDCSSPYAMAGLIQTAKGFDICFGNDPDADRHGIITKNGLMQPNHFLSVAVQYLLQNRPEWPVNSTIGKTCVTTSLIDAICEKNGKKAYEVPVGFKWFVPGLHSGSLSFGGEESAGASFLCKNGAAWSTDKDGILLCLLAAEIMAVTGKSPSDLYKELEATYGNICFTRIDAPASRKEKRAFSRLCAADITTTTLAGDVITATAVTASGNGENIGGLKVATNNGWFVARPSGTEDLYKIYAESMKGQQHLEAILAEAQALVRKLFES